MKRIKNMVAYTLLCIVICLPQIYIFLLFPDQPYPKAWLDSCNEAFAAQFFLLAVAGSILDRS